MQISFSFSLCEEKFRPRRSTFEDIFALPSDTKLYSVRNYSFIVFDHNVWCYIKHLLKFLKISEKEQVENFTVVKFKEVEEREEISEVFLKAFYNKQYFMSVSIFIFCRI